MRIPKRKSSENIQKEIDHYITQQKYDELNNELQKIEKNKPHAIEEVDRLAAMGDFSENAAYQMAKGRLRRLNYRSLEIGEFLKRAIIISPEKNPEKVVIGSQVTIADATNKEYTYQILGSAETDPSQGIISHKSQLGQALLGHKKNDIISISIDSKEKNFTIISIN